MLGLARFESEVQLIAKDPQGCCIRALVDLAYRDKTNPVVHRHP